jgi:hypothetical protein
MSGRAAPDGNTLLIAATSILNQSASPKKRFRREAKVGRKLKSGGSVENETRSRTSGCPASAICDQINRSNCEP